MGALKRDFSPADLKREMSRCGVDRTIAVQARQTLEETRWLLDLASDHPFIAGVIGWVDLQSPAVDAELEQISAPPETPGCSACSAVGGARISVVRARFAVGSGGSSGTA